MVFVNKVKKGCLRCVLVGVFVILQMLFQVVQEWTRRLRRRIYSARAQPRGAVRKNRLGRFFAAAPHLFDSGKKYIRPGNGRMYLKPLFHFKSAGIKLIIFTAFINKGLMVALLDNFTFFKHNDIFGVSYG